MATVQISPKQQIFLQSKAKNTVFVGGVGSGKTVIAAEKCVQLLLQGGYVLALASTYKQLKQVLFQEIQNRLRLHQIPFDVNIADMTIDIKATGGKVYGYSTESIESVRGITVDCAILDEAALMSLYDFQVAYGRLRRGILPLQVYLTTTPRGKDSWVYDLCQDPTTHFIHQRTDENPFLPKEFIEELKKQYDGDLLEQELNGGFIDGSDNLQFISTMSYLESVNRLPTPYNKDDLKIAGLDVARFGDDSSMLVYRSGNLIIDERSWSKIDTVELTDKVINWVIENGPDYLVVDSVGLGAGVFDSLHNKLKKVCKVIEFNGGYKATDTVKYANKRAEAFGRLKDWIKDNGCLTDEYKHLTSFRFKLNNKGQIQLESKSDLKTRIGKSPDNEDAMSMTFAIDAAKIQKVITKRKKPKQPYTMGHVVFAG